MRALGAQSFIKCGPHLLQIDQRHIHLPRHQSHCLRIAAEGILDPAIFAETSPTHRGAEQGGSAAPPGLRDHFTEVVRVIVERVGRGTFHVIVSELDDQIIPRLELAPDFVEPALGERPGKRFPRFRVVGDGHGRLKTAGDHLPPTVIGLGRLIADRGIPGQENGGHIHRGDFQSGHGGLPAQKFQREPVIPGTELRFFLARRQPHFPPGGDGGLAHIDDKLAGHHLARFRRDAFQHQPPQFGINGRFRGHRAAPKRHGHQIIALRQPLRKIKGSVACDGAALRSVHGG